VNEPLELPKTEEPLPDLTAELLSVETPVQEGIAPPVAVVSWLRLGYAVEFLVALLAILNLWSEVGGQGHLDLMRHGVVLRQVHRRHRTTEQSLDAA
jgi:hypothetical protein